jgi:ABC-2 type transport system ATP-binding protein
MSKNAVEIKNLRKIYKSKKGRADKEALKGIDLTIPKGSFFGLLGPNGAGKSTLINIMAGLVLKSEGQVKVNGFDLDKNPLDLRSSIGIVPQEVIVDPFFSVAETLDIYAGYFGVKKEDRRTEEILKAMHLWDKKDTSPRRLSGGMKRRLLIAKALVHNPSILILDEPTAGVDVELRTQLWDYVRKLNEEGTTILLTTHYLEEAEELCDHVSIINHGEVIANDNTKDLVKKLGTKDIIFFFDKEIKSIPSNLQRLKPQIVENNLGLKVNYNINEMSLSNILSEIKNAKLDIIDISTEETDLEDVFKELVKKV